MNVHNTGARSAGDSVSDCRATGVASEFDSGLASYFREIISTAILLLSYKRNYVHEILVNRLVKLVQKKMWLGQLTVSK